MWTDARPSVEWVQLCILLGVCLLVKPPSIDADHDPCVGQEYFVSLEIANIFIPVASRSSPSTRVIALFLVLHILGICHIDKVLFGERH